MVKFQYPFVMISQDFCGQIDTFLSKRIFCINYHIWHPGVPIYIDLPPGINTSAVINEKPIFGNYTSEWSSETLFWPTGSDFKHLLRNKYIRLKRIFCGYLHHLICAKLHFWKWSCNSFGNKVVFTPPSLGISVDKKS